MTPLVALAGCEKLPEGDGDERDVPAALAALGIDCEWVVWGGPVRADLVVLRATWDYAEHRAEFLDWCASVPRLANPAGVARWNTDKAYLAELAADGIPTVPTELVEPGERPHWPSGEFVVKPSVGAGSRGAARFGARQHAEAAAHLDALHADGRTAMVQPYQADVDTSGETALVFFGGLYSHAFTKGPMLPSSATDPSAMDGSGLFVGEKLGQVQPEPAHRHLAERTLDAAAARLGMRRAELLYARVDVVTGEQGLPRLLELELTEPSLGFAMADGGAPLRFASAVRAAL